MSKMKIAGQKETLRERLAKAEEERDTANRRAKKAEHDLKIAHVESTRLRNHLRWLQGTNTRRVAAF